MKHPVLALTLIACCMHGGQVMPQNGVPRVTASFPGSELKWTEIAAFEFKKHHVAVDRYTVKVIDEEDVVTVKLVNFEIDGSKTGRAFPEYEVVIRKADLKVIGSNYIR